jgi:hypothetical protein
MASFERLPTDEKDIELAPQGYDGRRVYSDKMPHPLALQTVRPRHREIMRRLICGETQREIAKALGLNEPRLSIICNSPLFKIELSKLERKVQARVIDSVGDVSARIAKLQAPAVDVLADIVDPKNQGVSYNTKRLAAMDILEMSGAKKNKAEDGMSDWAQFVSAAYAEAKQRHLERLNREIEIEVSSETPGEDTSGQTLSLADAEDEALINAPVTDIESEVEVEEGVSSAVPLSSGDVSSGAVSSAVSSDLRAPSQNSSSSSIASIVKSTINTGVVNGQDHAEEVKGEEGEGKRRCAELEGPDKKRPFVRYVNHVKNSDLELEDPEAARIVNTILSQRGLGAGLSAIKQLLDNNSE